MKIRDKKGITLIALIITIIIMLILAGVVLSLTIGENGIFKVAKYAVIKTEEEKAREKLELALADLQAHKYTDESYNESNYINLYLKNEGMQVVEDVVTVNGWRFKIDRTTPKIGENLGKGELEGPVIIIPYIGTSSFTIKNEYVYNEEEIDCYTYVLDDVEIKTSEDKEYTIEKELEAESSHTVKVIAKYKDGKTFESNIRTIKTEPRTYLYNNGDECIDITGGWEKAFSTYSGTGEKKKGYLYCYSPEHRSVYSTYFFRTANKISIEGYKKICFKVLVTVHNNGTGGHYAMFGIWDGKSYNYYNGSMIASPNGKMTQISVNINNDISVDIGDIKEETYIIGGISNGGHYDSISTNIYEVWLEK